MVAAVCEYVSVRRELDGNRDDLLAGRLEIAVAQRGLMCGAESDRSSPDTVLVRQKEVWA